MKKTTNLWLTRFYALVIVVVAVSDIFEGGALKLLLSLAAILIIVQTFLPTQADDR